MKRLLWPCALGLLGALALLVALRGEAAAGTAGGCAPTEDFVPAFCVNVPTAAARRETTVPMTSLPSQRADVRVEAGITAADAAEITASVDRSIARVETALGSGFGARPRVLIFATSTTFATGAAELFSYSRETAAYVAGTYGGIFDRPTATIAVNWSAAGGARMGAAIEHELVHLMVRELTAGNAIPVWLEEGIATVLEQESAPGAVATEDEQLAGLAVAASGATSLEDLETLADWHRAYARIGRPLYAFSANAVRSVTARIGFAGLARVLGAVGRGERFDEAYRTLTGEAPAALSLRLAADAVPAIAVGEAQDARGDRPFTVFAAVARAEVTVTISGTNGYRVSFTVRTDGLGLYRGSFGSTAAPGTYTVWAAGAAATIVTTR